MDANEVDVFESLIRKLERLNPLDEQDRAALRALPFKIVTDAAGSYLVRDGDAVTQCCLLLHGYACRNKMTSSGGRQIVSFHMAGDLLDVQHLLLPRADHNLQAITEVVTACIPIEALKAVVAVRPAVAEALWRDSLIDASVFREWVLNVGRRDAKSRIAHMLCEFAARCQAAGLGSAEGFDVPITQEQIADATGLTAVHVNRMLRELSEDGVISRKGRRISIVDWPGMQQVADFSRDYLHEAA
ncbi:Crp/Fnr family transcriptional regulator [Sphingomonas parva]|uniref:Crp/Fnr family transcriptional regulator n=1 Tax=Sphingomonas parva TaxID=2555898 RepID=A0A4Y8ZLD3_9SPHN|nr:Crp/Fnr family transcriptional regulator [Sphingomonas parva]TFI56808.1 Crp/Fnr family transcriptional regulator [Sphingomonas parva]